MVKVKCPECGEEINAEVLSVEGLPFCNYNAYCEKCDYHINESEWEEIS